MVKGVVQVLRRRKHNRVYGTVAPDSKYLSCLANILIMVKLFADLQTDVVHIGHEHQSAHVRRRSTGDVCAGHSRISRSARRTRGEYDILFSNRNGWVVIFSAPENRLPVGHVARWCGFRPRFQYVQYVHMTTTTNRRDDLTVALVVRTTPLGKIGS